MIDLLVILPSLEPRAQAHPSTPKVLWAKEHAPTPYSSTVLTLKSHLNHSRSLGACQPPSRGFDVIMVVVDRFSKMAHFIPTKENATAQETGRLLFMHVFKYHGLPKDIMLNRDSKFTSKFGELCGSAWGRSSRWTSHSNHKWMDKPKEWTWLSNNS
jgi:hypothetical protein